MHGRGRGEGGGRWVQTAKITIGITGPGVGSLGRWRFKMDRRYSPKHLVNAFAWMLFGRGE